ncbi:hypothetical protein LOTGIDRAFT_69652, partial [Lottia gigantea]
PVYIRDEVCDILSTLDCSKACGPDDVSSKVLKECRSVLAYPLSYLFNICHINSVFPSDWKLASINPLFKSGDSHVCKNYRPISLLSILGKVIEKCI